MLYSFAFKNATAKIQIELIQPQNKHVLTADNIESYLKILLVQQPEYILGLGNYSGKDQEDIRIETVTKNRFRNLPIEYEFPYTESLKIEPFIAETNYSKVTTHLGNSWCNLVSWKIMRLITDGYLHSKYSFLHVPKSFSKSLAVSEIEKMLKRKYFSQDVASIR